MAIFRIEKNKNYTVMSNYHFRDKRLSLKAKGLLSEMLSLPDDWDYSVSGLVAINKEKEDTIKSTLKELKDAGYLVVNKILPSKETGGKITYEYVIYETPLTHNHQEGENQHLDGQHLDYQPTENPPQLNTKEENTKELINKEVSKKENIQKKERFAPPSVEEVRAYCLERGNNIDPETFVDFYTSKNWMVGKTKMKDWKASVRTWERNNKNRQTPYKPKQVDTFIDDLDRIARGEHIEGHSEFDGF